MGVTDQTLLDRIIELLADGTAEVDVHITGVSGISLMYPP